MRRTIENGFELTGPIARGDWATVDAHLARDPASAPELEPLYRALAEATTRSVRIVRTDRRSCGALARASRERRAIGLVPTMGALHAGHVALIARRAGASATSSSSASSSTRRSSTMPPISPRYPRDEARDARRRRGAGVDVLFAPARRRDVPGRVPDLGRCRGARARPRGRAPARALPRRRDRLPEALQHRPAHSSPTSARRTRSRSRSSSSMVRDLESRRSRSASCRRCATPTAWRCRRATPALAGRARARRWRFRARSRGLAAHDRRRSGRGRPRRARRARRRVRRGRRLRRPPVLAVAVARRRHPADRQRVLDEERTMTHSPHASPHPARPAPGKLAAARARRAEARRRQPIVMVTAYDAPSARLADAAGVDIDPRRRLRRDDRARPRLDRAGDDGRDAGAHARRHPRRAPAARRRRHAVRVVPGLRRGRASRTRSASSRRRAPTR